MQFDMPRKKKVQKPRIVFQECEDCGAYPAMWRWFNNKTQCSDCATKDFRQYLALIAGGLAVIVIGIGILIF